ncbi:MAG: bifunctional proline dehydrogenase/L-glutamate gamma-semialdehyde dehydrogenase, partial [Chloroflexi bacterium]|nr:bifunctional proline dehydrogenase/L-glutamate gamma-semialdehyde dehydrogenase [Chloroflexota bacterium]
MQLGHELLQRIGARRQPWGTRARDALVGALTADEFTRARMLGLTDVLSRLPRNGGPRRAAGLVREYLAGDGLRLPGPLSLIVRAGTAPWVPDRVVGWTARRGVGAMASRFIVDAKRPALDKGLAKLTSVGRAASVDLLGEAVLSDGEADAYRDKYLVLLAELATHPSASARTHGGFAAIELSLKLSSLSARFNPVAPAMTLDDVGPRLTEILIAAKAAGIGIAVDAEQYRTRALVWHVFSEVLRQEPSLAGWGDVGVVLQAYHRDASDHFDDIVGLAEQRGVPMRVRLVKGAYWDEEVITAGQNGWPVPVFLDKAATDINFETIARRALERTDVIALAIASHNVRSHAHAQAVAESLDLPPTSIEHQTLYRTWPALSDALGGMGWPARDYVPVGDPEPGMAYLVRRVLENSSQVGFLARSRERLDESALLAPPVPGTDDLRYSRKPHASGFVNVPEARLFDPAEQAAFSNELELAGSRWGAHYPLRIGGADIETDNVNEDRSPSHPDGPPVGYVHEAGPEQVELALATANEAQPAWAARGFEERADILSRAAGLIQERKLALGAWVVHEAGRSWTEAVADVEEAADHLAWAASRLRVEDSNAYEPRGVVACIP